VESGGNFEAKGKSGEYGAYQFEPATWDSESQSVLGSKVPLDQATPEQQTQVAYTKIKQLKDQGMNVGQIASVWNAGNPDAYKNNNVGTNAEGVAYDTPAYAQKVAQTYQTIKNGGQVTPEVSGTPNVPDDTSSMPTWEKILFGVGGAALGAGAIALGQPEALPEAAALGEEAAGGTSGAAGILSKVGGAIKNAVTSKVGNLAEGVGLGSIPGIIGDITGNKANAQNAAGEEAATENAGATEANATKQSEEANAENENEINDEQESQQALQNTKAASQAYNAQLATTSSGTKLMQTPQGQLGIQSLATNGIVPNQNQEGKFETLQNQQELSKLSSDLNNKEQDLHSASGDTGNLEDVRSEAKQAVRQDNRIPSTDWESADKIIDERMDSYRQRMGENPTLGRGGIGQIRRDGYKSFDHNASSATNAAGRALGRAANKHMLDKSSAKELIGGIHKEKEKLIAANKVLKHLDGKKALNKHGFIQKALHGTGKYAALYIGDRLGGPIGAVIGDMVGKNIIKAADKRYGKSVFEKPAVRKALEMVNSKDPAIHKKIEKQLKKYGVKMETLKKDLEHAKVMEQKRGEYKEKKKTVLEGEKKKSGYSPYTEPGIIKLGKKPISKYNKIEKGLPIIR
jgi:hypothetical protein